MEKSIKQQLAEFEQAIGQEFTLVGEFACKQGFKDTIAGINHKEEMIIGEEYGEFHVGICKLLKVKSAELKKNQPQLF